MHRDFLIPYIFGYMVISCESSNTDILLKQHDYH